MICREGLIGRKRRHITSGKGRKSVMLGLELKKVGIQPQAQNKEREYRKQPLSPAGGKSKKKLHLWGKN